MSLKGGLIFHLILGNFKTLKITQYRNILLEIKLIAFYLSMTFSV